MEEKDHELRRGESPTNVVFYYETRIRHGHTEVKVFDRESLSLVWKQLPKEADPQYQKKAELRLIEA